MLFWFSNEGNVIVVARPVSVLRTAAWQLSMHRSPEPVRMNWYIVRTKPTAKFTASP